MPRQRQLMAKKLLDIKNEAARRSDIFSDVYEHSRWGVSPSGAKYYSDSPDHDTATLRTYISTFVRRHAVKTVVDLACGDFQLASGVDFGGAHYIGSDIVPALIDWNRSQFSRADREFHVIDMVEDPLPAGDLCMIHAALYLLSERDIFRVLRKLGAYPYVLITDGQPEMEPSVRKNFDKPTDRFTRQDYFGSGLWLELEPYELDLEVVIENTLRSGEIMRTVLLRHPRVLRATDVGP